MTEGEAIVLGIPRGGVEVAAEIASSRGWDLDVVIPRKVRAPFNPELGLGAIAPGVRVIDEAMVKALRIPTGYLASEVATQEEEIRRRAARYRRGKPPVDVGDKVAVLVDDGIATGGTARAAVRWARAAGASRVVLAVPVAPPDAVRDLAKEADEVVCLETPDPFRAVGEWYAWFPQVSDDEVVALLAR